MTLKLTTRSFSGVIYHQIKVHSIFFTPELTTIMYEIGNLDRESQREMLILWKQLSIN